MRPPPFACTWRPRIIRGRFFHAPAGCVLYFTRATHFSPARRRIPQGECDSGRSFPRADCSARYAPGRQNAFGPVRGHVRQPMLRPARSQHLTQPARLQVRPYPRQWEKPRFAARSESGPAWQLFLAWHFICRKLRYMRHISFYLTLIADMRHKNDCCYFIWRANGLNSFIAPYQRDSGMGAMARCGVPSAQIGLRSDESGFEAVEPCCTNSKPEPGLTLR